MATLVQLAAWFAFAGESIHNTTTAWPYQYQEGGGGNTYYFTQSTLAPHTFVFFWGSVVTDATGCLLISSYKPSMLVTTPAAVRRLTVAGPVDLPWSIGEMGLSVNVSSSLSVTSYNLSTYYRAYSNSSADNAPCATRDCAVYSTDQYVRTAQEGVCYTAAANTGEPMVPLFLFFNGGTDNMAGPSPPDDGQAGER